MLRRHIAFLVSVAIAISYLDRQTLPVAAGEIRKENPISNSIKALLDSAFLLILATVRSLQPLPLPRRYLTA